MTFKSRSEKVLEVCKASPIVPVLTIDKIETAVPLARALVQGGLKVVEITLRTDCAWQAIEEITQALPELKVGVGTVLREEHIQRATEIGADFVVTPGTTKTLIQAAKEYNVSLIPGVATSSEVMLLAEHGYLVQKLFPVSAIGGTSLLKAFQGPLSDIKFFPTGGVTAENAAEFLCLENVLCVGGSWMVPKEKVKIGDWDGIKKLTKDALTLVCDQE